METQKIIWQVLVVSSYIFKVTYLGSSLNVLSFVLYKKSP